ncbi:MULTISPECIES: SCO3242 family prenyltransferase [Amycolatopsis]|uniref:UbiA family prenyltransferase n=1 Tax=Amycolatopsis tucumanensis TaxID=401106 RepID=A0ABP7J433_9PSEU|nr:MULTISPECIES: UbiA family prenyltransferase [Amycolatopsis]MCF6425320.1 UbiA family prenyltransferase [Amycolatopsis tucumanensis]
MNPYVQLVRAPAALSVLGDTVAGAAAAGRPLRGRRLALPLASVAIYWSGMALNDWADRELDAVERPERPIPSGRISPQRALGVAAGLTGAGLGLAAVAGGRDALKVAAPLAAAVWAYDTVLKKTPLAPAAMALCRSLDVLLGAGRSGAAKALVPAAVLGGHTLGVTALSAGEVHGASPARAAGALALTSASAAAAVSGRGGAAGHRVAALAAAAGYGVSVGSKQYAAVRKPTAAVVRTATAAGIHGMVPLQAALAARRGGVLGAGLVALALPLAKRLGRKVSPT